MCCGTGARVPSISFEKGRDEPFVASTIRRWLAAVILVQVLTAGCGGRSSGGASDDAVLVELQQALAKAWLTRDRTMVERIIGPEWTSTGRTAA